MEAAKLFLAIFANPNFKRLVLEEVGILIDERKKMLANIQRCHENLLPYLQAMLNRAHHHIVKIAQDMSLEVDGKNMEGSGAAVRAVIALACVRDEKWFLATDLNNLYYGTHTEGEAASEFTTIIRGAKRLLPRLAYQSDHQGKRSISEVHFVVSATNQQLKQELSSIYLQRLA